MVDIVDRVLIRAARLFETIAALGRIGIGFDSAGPYSGKKIQEPDAPRAALKRQRQGNSRSFRLIAARDSPGPSDEAAAARDYRVEELRILSRMEGAQIDLDRARMKPCDLDRWRDETIAGNSESHCTPSLTRGGEVRHRDDNPFDANYRQLSASIAVHTIFGSGKCKIASQPACVTWTRACGCRFKARQASG